MSSLLLPGGPSRKPLLEEYESSPTPFNISIPDSIFMSRSEEDLLLKRWGDAGTAASYNKTRPIEEDIPLLNEHTPPRKHAYQRLPHQEESPSTFRQEKSLPCTPIQAVETPDPVVIIESKYPSRSGSVVSRLATLRNRHRIVNRNKMIRRKDVSRHASFQNPEVARHGNFQTPGVSRNTSYKTINMSHNTSVKAEGGNIGPDHIKDRSQSTSSGLEWNDPEYYSRTFNAYANVDNSRSYNKSKSRYFQNYFQFPIKRKTSLKRKPNKRNGKGKGKVSNPNFKSTKELNTFMDSCFQGADVSLLEVLPKFIEFFEFQGIFNSRPKLESQSMDVKSSGISRLDMLSRQSPPTPSKKVKTPPKQSPQLMKMQISAPIKETFTKNGYNPFIGEVNDPTRLGAAAGAVADGHNFIGTADDVNVAIEKRRSERTDPPILLQHWSPETTSYSHFRETVFNSKNDVPLRYADIFPGNTIPRKKAAQMDRTLYFDVLLRRTIAAKIKYRLSNNTYRLLTQELENYSSSNSDGSEINDLHDLPKLSRSNSTDSESDTIDTADLIKNSASLLSSDLLPSPQISYSTDIFAKLEVLELEDLDLQKSQISLPLLPTNRLPAFTRKTSQRQVDFENNDFRFPYHGALGFTPREKDAFVMKPMNRSKETLSSSDSFYSPEHDSSHTPTNSSSSAGTSAGSQLSKNKHIHSKLDDIVDQITSFMETELHHSPSFSRPSIFQYYSPQSPPRAMFHTLKSSSSVLVVNTNSKIHNPTLEYPFDIKSLQGSIHVAKTDISSSPSDFHNFGVMQTLDNTLRFQNPRSAYTGSAFGGTGLGSSAGFTRNDSLQRRKLPPTFSMSSSIYSGTTSS